MKTDSAELREQLAAYAHGAWSGWMRYMFKEAESCAGDVVIPVELAKRWSRQMKTDYADLSESEKESDRKEADRMLAIMEEHNE